MEQILLQGISLEELLRQIEELIDKKFEKSHSQFSKSKETLLSRKEVASLFKISLPTLHQWTKQGLLYSLKIGNRVLYKLADIEKLLANSK